MKKEIEANTNPTTFGERLLFWLMSNPNKALVIMRVGDVLHIEGATDEHGDRPPHQN